MNTWYVVDEDGDVVAHDLSEMKAHLLVSELNSSQFVFSYGDGMVGYDNQPTCCLDNAMSFGSRYVAENELSKIQKDWVPKLEIVEIKAEQTYEARC